MVNIRTCWSSIITDAETQISLGWHRSARESSTDFHKALESDQPRMGLALLLIAQLYRVEKEARSLMAEERIRLRQLQSQPILEKLRNYLLEIQVEVLPKSPEGRAVRNTLKNWTALTRLLRGRRSPN